MNKADLVDRIAGACNISKALATTAIDTAVDSVTAALKKGDRVALIGFGTFSVSQRKALPFCFWRWQAAVGGWQERQRRRVFLPTVSCELPSALLNPS